MNDTEISLKSVTSSPRISPSNRGWRFALFFILLLAAHGLVWASTQNQPLPSSGADDSVLFREGEFFLNQGDPERALWRFKTLITDFPDSSLVNESKFRMGICYTQLKRPKDAIRILNELFSGFLAPARMVQVFSLLGDNHLELKEPLTALQWYGKGLLVPNQANEELRKKVRAIIDTFESEETLNQVESLYRGAYAGGYAKFKLAQLAKARGDEALAQKILAEHEQEYRTMEGRPPLKELSAPSLPSVNGKYAVGVILPLSGLYQAFGERVLQGIQLAVQENERPGKAPLIGLAIRDSKGDPLEAEKAVEDLASQEKVIAILGPILGLTVERAAKKAQQVRVPLLTLSQKETLPSKDDFVFQNSLTPSAQMETLAAFAVKELELRTFGVFYPNSSYGLHFKQLFTQEVTKRGGKVTGSVAYQEDQTDFSQEIKFFFKVRAIPREESRDKNEVDFVSSPSVDGLFIPDAYQRVGLILQQMAYFNVTGLTLLGSNAWNHPGLLSAAGKLAEGAFFVDAFSKGDPSLATEQFVREFSKTYGRDPETLEALGYESAELLKNILGTKMVSSPSQLKEEIHRIQDFQGASGLRGFGEDGRAIRTLSILRVNKGQIEHFSP